MKIKRILSLALVAALVLALAMSGCGNADNNSSTASTAGNESSTAPVSSAPASSDTGNADGEVLAADQIITYQQPEVRTWDTTQCGDTGSGTMLAHTTEGLFRYKYDDAGAAVMEPAGCTEYEISDDGLTYTFHLRENKWSDGEPVTADDYVYAVKRLLEPDLAAAYAFFATGIVGAADYNAGTTTDFSTVGVKAVDDMTVEYTLAEVDATFLEKVGTTVFFPLREDIAEQYGDAYGANADEILSCGPYIVTEWTDKDTGVMVKNDQYWDAENVIITEVDLQYVEEAATRDKLFKQGDLAQIGGSTDYLEEYRTMAKNGECQEVHRDADGGTFYLNFKMEGSASGLMGNAKIRTAVGYAVDNTAYCETIMKRLTPADSFVPPNTMLGDKTYREQVGMDPWAEGRAKYRNNPEELQKLFKEGLTELGKPTDDLSQYTIKYLTYGESSTSRQAQELFQQNIEQNLGVKCEIQVCADWASYGKAVDEGGEAWDLSMNGWSPDYPDPMTYMDMWISTGTSNLSGYKNPEYDALIDKALKTVQPADRVEIYKEAEQLLCDDMVIMPFYFSDVNSFILNNVKGIQIGSLGFSWSVIDAYVIEE